MFILYLFCSGCSLVDVNLSYKDCHTFTPISTGIPFSQNPLSSHLFSGSWSFSQWPWVYIYILFPHKVDEQASTSFEAMPIGSISTNCWLQGHHWVGLPCSSSPFSVCSHIPSQYIHEPSSVFYVLHQLVIRDSHVATDVHWVRGGGWWHG